MATTLAELEQRLQVLEQEVVSLRKLIQSSLPTQTPAEREAALHDLYQRMGISGEAPGIENLRALLVAEGVLPGDEIVRQVIAAMRPDEEQGGE
jgi:hypothetical protein